MIILNKLKREGLRLTIAAIFKKIWRILLLFVPPIIHKLSSRLILMTNNTLPTSPKALPNEFSALPRSQYGLYKLITDFEFNSVLDIGSGSGEHAAVLKNHGKKVTALDFGKSVYSFKSHNNFSEIKTITIDFYAYETQEKYDCIWASHVLEHQPDPGSFIKKLINLTADNGLICITVPPLKNKIVGGHLTLWNAGLLLYQLVFNGLDCRNASICTYGYNITIIVKKKLRADIELVYDKGDIRRLKEFFPTFIDEPFDGVIERWNW